MQVTVDNTLLGVAEGAIGTLFQEFLLRHFTHGTPTAVPHPCLAALSFQIANLAQRHFGSFSVSSDIFAVRSSLSQLKGLPSMARLIVLASTIEKTCR